VKALRKGETQARVRKALEWKVGIEEVIFYGEEQELRIPREEKESSGIFSPL